jgi:Glu-tRNA(Gln) amidotransferase subunit E-like FAD-binding protein
MKMRRSSSGARGRHRHRARVITERALMLFDGIPPETRKSFEDGTTIFERVLPGADPM